MGEPRFQLEVVERVRASREVVFSYFTDAARMGLWIGGRATLDARPGGRYRIEMTDGPTAAGEYREIDPPRRLVLTWGMEGSSSMPAGSTSVEITLTQTGDITTVRLRHLDLPDETAQRQHREGWVERLVQLADQTFG